MGIVRVFSSKEEQADLAKRFSVVERYDGFILLKMSPRQRDTLAASLPVEDITRNYDLKIGSRRIRTDIPRIDPAGKTLAHPAYKDVGKLPLGKHHYLVQFVGPVKKAWVSRAKKLGAEPRIPYTAYGWVMRCTRAAIMKLAAEPFVRWAGHLSHRDRLSIGDAAKKLPRTRGLAQTFRVEFFSGSDCKRAGQALSKAGARVLARDQKWGIATVEIAGSPRHVGQVLNRLSAVHGVRVIRRHAFKRASNDVGTAIMATARASAAPLNLSGNGEIVAVCDTGLDLGSASTIHPDFVGRVVAIKSYPITSEFSRYIRNPKGDDGAADVDSGHGTHVAGSVLGSGVVSQKLPGQARPIRGLAHRARLVFQAVEQEIAWKNPADLKEFGRYLLAGLPQDLTGLFQYAYSKGARIHSNSWGGGEPGEYDAQCRQLDAFVWKRRDFCVLVAAGNDGTDKDGDGVINQMSVTSPGTAKNCITVGASESLRREFDGERYGDWWPNDYPTPPFKHAPMANGPSQVVAFSSRGPTEDGRIKPEVVAPGTFILSTRSRALSPSDHAWSAFPESPDYFFMGGTSMATPLTSGAVACLREFLRKWVGYPSPSAALLKASLIGGATKLRGASPDSEVYDNDQGYGLVNLDAIVATSGSVAVYFHDDIAGLATGQIDTFDLDVRSSNAQLRVSMAYSDYPGPQLVNNLNVILVSPDGRQYAGNGAGGTTLTLDNVNNAEVIRVDRPSLGGWRLRIVASNVPEGPQPYAFMITGAIRM